MFIVFCFFSFSKWLAVYWASYLTRCHTAVPGYWTWKVLCYCYIHLPVLGRVENPSLTTLCIVNSLIFFIFLNKRNLQKLFLLCVFPKSLKTCIRTWANVLLTSSDWSSIYQSSHWDTSQCQGVCGPFLSSVTNFFKQDIGSMCNMPDVKQNLPIQGAWAQVNKKPQMLDV